MLVKNLIQILENHQDKEIEFIDPNNSHLVIKSIPINLLNNTDDKLRIQFEYILDDYLK